MIRMVFVVIYSIVILATFLTIYMTPTIIAYIRNHNNTLPIGVLNFLFGWSFLGWVAALVWALTDNTIKTGK